MQDTKIESMSETQQLDAPVRSTTLSTSFDEAEYQRWSEKLKNRNRKDK